METVRWGRFLYTVVTDAGSGIRQDGLNRISNFAALLLSFHHPENRNKMIIYFTEQLRSYNESMHDNTRNQNLAVTILKCM